MFIHRSKYAAALVPQWSPKSYSRDGIQRLIWELKQNLCQAHRAGRDRKRGQEPKTTPYPAEQGLAPDCQQRPLLRRSRCWQQVKPGVRPCGREGTPRRPGGQRTPPVTAPQAAGPARARRHVLAPPAPSGVRLQRSRWAARGRRLRPLRARGPAGARPPTTREAAPPASHRERPRLGVRSRPPPPMPTLPQDSRHRRGTAAAGSGEARPHAPPRLPPLATLAGARTDRGARPGTGSWRARLPAGPLARGHAPPASGRPRRRLAGPWCRQRDHRPNGRGRGDRSAERRTPRALHAAAGRYRRGGPWRWVPGRA